MIELQNSAPRCIGPYCAQAPVQAMNGNGMNGMNGFFSRQLSEKIRLICSLK